MLETAYKDIGFRKYCALILSGFSNEPNSIIFSVSICILQSSCTKQYMGMCISA